MSHRGKKVVHWRSLIKLKFDKRCFCQPQISNRGKKVAHRSKLMKLKFDKRSFCHPPKGYYDDMVHTSDTKVDLAANLVSNQEVDLGNLVSILPPALVK